MKHNEGTNGNVPVDDEISGSGDDDESSGSGDDEDEEGPTTTMPGPIRTDHQSTTNNGFFFTSTVSTITTTTETEHSSASDNTLHGGSQPRPSKGSANRVASDQCLWVLVTLILGTLMLLK